jgi:hypothetical protein
MTKGWPTIILKEGCIGKMELWILEMFDLKRS